MREAGYSEETCLVFDRAALTFVQRYRRMRDATKQVRLDPEERRKSRKPVPMKTVPAHTEEELLEMLGVVLDENEPEVKEILGQLDSEMWDTVEWSDEEEPEP